MKHSTNKNSFSTVVGGLVFWPREADFKDKDAHISVHAWLEAGAPSGCYVFDNADTLRVCGIPVCDAQFIRGLYVRLPRLLKPRSCTVDIVRGFLQELEVAQPKKKVKGIQAAVAEKRKKMVY